MRMIDIIEKKRDKKKLTKEEIEFFVYGYTKGEIPDYQVSSLLMAIYLNGMDNEETVNLTMAMANSGDMLDLTKINGCKVDKHSTGGVGDKTSLIVAPIAAACGVKIAKMSGRALGFSGGTIDKLESFDGIKLRPDVNDFIKQVNDIGIALIAQTGDLAPADKKLYALRDITGTVGNKSLIAGSIMSKKLAAGCDKIVIDVKVGSGAFMTTLDDARELAKIMSDIGKGVGRDVCCVLTNMDEPLGTNVGNILEVKEAIEVLQGHGPSDMVEVASQIASYMVMLGLGIEHDEAMEKVQKVIEDGSALEKLRLMIETQGGDTKYFDDLSLFPEAKFKVNVLAGSKGYIKKIITSEIGRASNILGAGRETKEDDVDLTAGLQVFKKTGQKVEEGDIIATLYTNKEEVIGEVTDIVLNAYEITDELVDAPELIYDIIR
ncbi:MAG: thymidine phosphorylase [Clostridia bacterium]|nr:thymidine phosphorylase [Clostridia bacterium]